MGKYPLYVYYRHFQLGIFLFWERDPKEMQIMVLDYWGGKKQLSYKVLFP